MLILLSATCRGLSRALILIAFNSFALYAMRFFNENTVTRQTKLGEKRDLPERFLLDIGSQRLVFLSLYYFLLCFPSSSPCSSSSSFFLFLFVSFFFSLTVRCRP